jgi:hypothetical protein
VHDLVKLAGAAGSIPTADEQADEHEFWYHKMIWWQRQQQTKHKEDG